MHLPNINYFLKAYNQENKKIEMNSLTKSKLNN